MSDRDQSPPGGAGGNADEQPKSEHLNIKVTDNNNEVFFKIKRTTALSKLMNAFCDRQGKNLQSVRFLFDGSRVNPADSPESVGLLHLRIFRFTYLSLRQRSVPNLRFPSTRFFPRDHAANTSLSSIWPTETLWRSIKNRLGATKDAMVHDNMRRTCL